MLRKILTGFLLLIILAAPALRAARAPQEVYDYQYKEKSLSVGKHDERQSFLLPARPLAFETEIPYQASVENKKSKTPAYLRFKIVLPGGNEIEELRLGPGDKKSGTIRLSPGQQLRVEMYAGQYSFLFIKSGADIKCSLKWPELRFIAREQSRHYGFDFSVGGWADIDRWSWEFGDGQRAAGTQVSHVYRRAGTYKMRIIGYQGNTPVQSYSRDMVVPEFIQTNPQVGPLTGSVELKVVCHSGMLSHYGEDAVCTWDFGDGSPSVAGDDVEHVYDRPGRYRLTMLVRHLTSNHKVTRSWDVTAKPITIHNRGQVTPVEGYSPVRIDCLAQPSVDGSPVQLVYNWDFGDGNYSNQPKTSHTYSRPGTYRVTLHVSDQLHPEVTTNDLTYTVRVLPPSLSLSPLANPTSGKAPLTVLFVPGLTVKGYPVDLRYQWDFGDGDISREATPLHTYERAGEYTVRVTVTDVLNRTEARGQLRISVAGSQLTATATVEPSSGRSPLRVICRAQAATADGNTADLSYEWDFGDRGQTATGQQVSYTYHRKGTYQVVLTVRDLRPGHPEYVQVVTKVTVY